MAVAAWALTRFTSATTGSESAAAAGAALLVANPNLLYLQSTPMTEPLLIATCMLAVHVTAEWVAARAPLRSRAAGWAIVAACMTRYEAWPICAALIGAGAARAAAARGCHPVVSLVRLRAARALSRRSR